MSYLQFCLSNDKSSPLRPLSENDMSYVCRWHAWDNMYNHVINVWCTLPLARVSCNIQFSNWTKDQRKENQKQPCWLNCWLDLKCSSFVSLGFSLFLGMSFLGRSWKDMILKWLSVLRHFKLFCKWSIGRKIIWRGILSIVHKIIKHGLIVRNWENNAKLRWRLQPESNGGPSGKCSYLELEENHILAEPILV